MVQLQKGDRRARYDAMSWPDGLNEELDRLRAVTQHHHPDKGHPDRDPEKFLEAVAEIKMLRDYMDYRRGIAEGRRSRWGGG
jgi:hypothetical protein